jgi:hypothetical protein
VKTILQEKKSFLLVIQTKFQKQMMQEHGHVRARRSLSSA